ncbi:hypothetical protein A8711_18020 [Micromonospora sp. II]|nr:hypothetical protein A8711_18020 [Micromonospora sp. II]
MQDELQVDDRLAGRALLEGLDRLVSGGVTVEQDDDCRAVDIAASGQVRMCWADPAGTRASVLRSRLSMSPVFCRRSRADIPASRTWSEVPSSIRLQLLMNVVSATKLPNAERSGS